MKYLTPILILICVFTGYTQAQNVDSDYTHWSLPEGAIARIGKGTINSPVIISPESNRFVIASFLGIWLYNLQTYQEIALLAAHKPPCTSLAFSPDGSTLATGSEDGKIRVWDPETGQQKTTLAGHKNRIDGLFFTQDGETLISIGDTWDNGTIQLWDAKTWKHRTKLTQMVSVRTVTFSPNSGVLALSHSKGIGLWDIKTAKLITNITDEKDSFTSVYRLMFSPNGEILAVGNDSDIYLWDTKTHKLRGALIGHESSVSFLKFSPDSKILASASWRDANQGKAIWLWDTATGQHKATLLGHTGGVRLFEFSTDSNTLASTSDDLTIRLWDINTGNLKVSLIGHEAELFSLQFSPDGANLIGRGWDSTIHSWDLETGKHRNDFTGQTHMRTTKFPQKNSSRITWYSPVVFSADKQTFHCANADDTIWMYNTNTGKLEKKLTGYTFTPYEVVFSPDRQTLANTYPNNTIHLWNMDTGRRKAILNTNIEKVKPMGFSPDGNILASRGQNNVQLWNVKADTSSVVFKRSLLKQAQRLVSYAQDRAPLQYQMHLGNMARNLRKKEIRSKQYRGTLKGHTGLVETVAFSPDGKTLASGGGLNDTTQQHDSSIRLWDLQTAQSKVILKGHSSGIRSLSFSPDGKVLASGSYDNSIRLWNTLTGENIAILTGHLTSIYCVMFSPDGKTLASGSHDTTIRLWDVQSGKHKKTLNGHTRAVFFLTFSPDGEILASVSYDGTILLWDEGDKLMRHIISIIFLILSLCQNGWR